MNNINKQVTPDPHYSYEAFDLSARQVFNVNVGELIPVCCREVVPNDKFSVKVSDFVRALPMVTSPFVRAKQHLDFYFVPYTQLWSNWNQFITQRKQSFSSALGDTTFIPHFNLQQLYNQINRSTNNYDIVGRDFRRGAFRLLNMLGYSYHPENFSSQSMSSYIAPRSCNAFRIAAYNKIWYDYYRQQQFDNGKHLLEDGPGEMGVTVPYDLFNYDYLLCKDLTTSDLLAGLSQPVSSYPYARAKNFVSSCQMRYRTWKKDLFTGLLPNTQFGAVSSLTFPVSVDKMTNAGSSFGQNLLSALSSGPLRRVQVDNIPSSSSENTISQGVVNLTGSSVTDIFALRKAYAVQKWRERALRAGNRVDNNVQAHYGSKPNYHNDWHPDYLGSVSGNLSIGDVDATAQVGDGDNQQLGNVAGKAIMSFDGHAFNFQNAGDFGVIMGIYSILPEGEYNAVGIDRENQLLEREDFFIEEYQNLGYEAVTGDTYSGLTSPDASASARPAVIGYAPRYWNYKTAIDKVFGQFMRFTRSDYPFATPLGAFSHWVSPRPDFSIYNITKDSAGAITIPLNWFYVSPRIFDSVFNASVDPVSSTSPDNFQFLVSLYMDCKAYRTMSVIGLPEL